ncbi:hypothetical protein DBR42_06990 [Pelomonas sp. HMWF004]|nr:hypothetical protein DBR42_06990 [Pelomonas sp. HMWF004]
MQFTREVGFRFPLCRGEDVRAIQQALTILQSEPPCGTVDGIYGGATKLAVAEYQRRNNLEATGVVDAPTWRAMFEAAAARQQSLPQGAASALVASAARSSAPPVTLAMATATTATAGTAPADLPVSRPQALRARDWLLRNFGPQIEAAVSGTPVDTDLVAAIACKETANIWLQWIDRLSPAEVLARCVFDGSGDVPGTSRRAFPSNAAAFRASVGDALTDELIDEANETRKLRGFGPQRWLYKGYGLFQYDLQHFEKDPGFFRERQWRSFDSCMDRYMREMRDKLRAANGNLADAVRRYNGSGPKAEEYREHVMFIYGWLKATPATPLH